MIIQNYNFSVTSQGFGHTHDITPQAKDALSEAGIKKGIVTVMVPGSTAAVTTIEYEPGVIADLNRALEILAPQDIPYEHDKAWGDGNGFSHVRAALLGPSLTVPVVDGDLSLGTWQQIVLIDCDNRQRQRKYVIQVIGEGKHSGS